MISRRNFLNGASTMVVCAPAIVRAECLMAVRGIIMPVQHIYYGYCDRLQINYSYRSAELRGRALIQFIEEGLLRHIPAAHLRYDLARWGTAELSFSSRRERAAFFNFGPEDLRQLTGRNNFR